MYGSLEASLWSFGLEKNWINWWNPCHDWQHYQQVNQVHSQKHEGVWVYYQAGSAGRHSISLIQDEKGQPFFTAMKNKSKDFAADLFDKLKDHLRPNMFCFFSDEKHFCEDQIMSWNKLSVFSVNSKCTEINGKLTPSSYNGVWGSHKRWWLYVSNI